MELSNEIQEIIKKHLIGAHADALKEFIEQSKELEKTNKQLKDKYEKLNESVQKLIAENGKLYDENLKAKSILQREDALNKEETAFLLDKKLFEIESKMFALQITEATKRSDSLFTLVGLLCKNSEAIKMFTEHKSYQTTTNYSNGNPRETKIGESGFGEEKIKNDKGDIPPAGTIDQNN